VRTNIKKNINFYDLYHVLPEKNSINDLLIKKGCQILTAL